MKEGKNDGVGVKMERNKRKVITSVDGENNKQYDPEADGFLVSSNEDCGCSSEINIDKFPTISKLIP